MNKMIFEDLLIEKDGLIKGPFGSDVKKSLFVPYKTGVYKVYEQSVVLNRNIKEGSYYLEEEYVDKKLARFLVKGGDYLLTGAGTLGELFKVPQEAPKGIINQALLRIRLNENKIEDLFFPYYFKFHIKSIIKKLNGDSVIPNLPPLPIIKSTEVEIPSKEEQLKIASVLSSLDSKIELNNKINKELENLAKTIYEYWFVQNVEESWAKKKIEELIHKQKNGDWGKETKEGNYTEKVTCIRGADINSLVGNSELKAPERYIIEKNKSKFLCDGDFVIEISGGSPTQSTGRIAYILEEMLKGFENPLICSNFCKVISLKDKNLFYYFIFIWQQLYDNGLFLGFEGKTSGIKNFLFDNFVNSYKIVIPPSELLKKFNTTVSPIFSQIIKNRQENVALARVRDFLLPLLMNGQVTVGESQNEPTIIPFKKFVNDDTKYQTWKTQVGLAARGDIDEQTLRNIYEAIDENDR